MSELSAVSPVVIASPHPRGLRTLFFTEMWERFSYYGMRALLVLFMVRQTAAGGMGLSDEVATAIYGLYTAGVYLMALPGGWLADRIWGAQRTVWYGGIIIALGHFTLAVPWTQTFYLGLVLVVVGSGILKPNMSALVGELYPEGGARRDAGFTIFYMGVNLGAALGPLVCCYLAQRLGWHWGFAAAGVGMVLGLGQFRWTRHLLGNIGAAPPPLQRVGRVGIGVVAATVAVVAAVSGLCLAGMIVIYPPAVARFASLGIVLIAVVYFTHVFFLLGLDRVEQRRVLLILVLFLAAALFWAGFEQAGSSFNLFAERHTERAIGSTGLLIPAGWFQSLGAVFVIALAPVMAALWVALACGKWYFSIPMKFGFGLLFLALGFGVMAAAAGVAATGSQVLPVWLVATYLIHTIGELCLSPVGLSAVTKLAPRKLIGQMMGLWFLASALGNLLAGLLAGALTSDGIQHWSAMYLKIAALPVAAGLLLMVFSRQLRDLAPDVR
ncbi:MAG: peptide MFS transporter [Verrucomicrobia bacterium]|nr:MAG: peptide MFS transporter [Verrucomicrobiota bacterium]